MNDSSQKGVYYLAQAAAIAALYMALTYLSASLNLAYGPFQFRISEVLTILPIFTPAAIPGLTIGCFLGNLGSPLGPIDWVVGTGATFLAAMLTYALRGVRIKDIPFLAPMAPVVMNGVIVGLELAFLGEVGFSLANFQWASFGFFALTVGFGELVVCYALGVPLILFLQKTGLSQKLFPKTRS